MEKQYEHLLVNDDILENGGPADTHIVDQVLQRQYGIVVVEDLTLREYINELENNIKVFKKASVTKVNNNSDKALTMHELALQDFLANSIGRSILASMTYGVSGNNGEIIDFSKLRRCKLFVYRLEVC